MIKGVSRYAVEVAVNDSPFFEKVICFVRPQYAGGSALDLHREALRMADHLGARVEEAQNGSRHVLRGGSSRPSAAVQPARAEQSDGQSPKPPGGGAPRWLPLLLSAGGGAAAAILISAVL